MLAGTGMALGKLLLPREAVCSEARAPTCGGAIATRTHRRLLPLNLQDRLPAGVCPRSALRPSELDSCPICQRSVLRGYAASFSALPSNRVRTSLIRDPSASPLTGALKLRYVGS